MGRSSSKKQPQPSPAAFEDGNDIDERQPTEPSAGNKNSDRQVQPQSKSYAAPLNEGTRRSGRTSLPTERRADALDNEQQKQTASKAKAHKVALRARQAVEEANDFRDTSLGPESEQEYYPEDLMAELHKKQQFTISAAPPERQSRKSRLVRRANIIDSDSEDEVPIKTLQQAQDSDLVHRTGSVHTPAAEDSSTVVQVPIRTGPNPNLVRRAARAGQVLTEDGQIPNVPSPKGPSRNLVRRAGALRDENIAPSGTPQNSAVINSTLIRRAGLTSKQMPRMVLNLRTTGQRAREYAHEDTECLPLPRPLIAHLPTPSRSDSRTHVRTSSSSAAHGYTRNSTVNMSEDFDNLYERQPLFYRSDGDEVDGVHVNNEEMLEMPARGTSRAAPPSTSSVTTRILKKQKTSLGSGSRGRVVIADFGALQQAIIILAQRLYRCKICTDWPYPKDVEEQGMAMEAWTQACQTKNVHMEFDENMLKLITARGTQVRSELKTKARILAVYEYGLQESGSKSDIRETREKVENLLDGTSYVFKNPAERTGLYEHSIIQALINETWFANKHDEGVVYSDYFKPGIPLVTIALVLTAVQCALDEWRTGQKSDIQFTEAAYRPSFENHLRALEKFERRMKDMQVMSKIQRKLLRRARAYAKVSEEEEAVSRDVYEDADLDAARKEWEGRGDSGDESN